jgi:hypothetical protein
MDFNKIILDRIRYNQPKKINGKYISRGVYLTDDNNLVDITLRTPYLQIYKLTQSYIELAFDVEDKEFYIFLNDMDDYNIKVAYENSRKWFGDDLPLEIIDEYHKPYIRFTGLYPSLRIKINNELYNILSKIDKLNEKFMSVVMLYDGLKFLKQQFSGEWSVIDYDIEKQYEFNEVSNIDNIENKIIDNKIPEIPEIPQITENKNVDNKIPDKIPEIIENKIIENPDNKISDNRITDIGDKKDNNIKKNIKNNKEDRRNKKRIMRLGGGKIKFLD